MFKKSLSLFWIIRIVRFVLWISIPFLMYTCSPKENDMDFKLSTDPAIFEYFDGFETEALKFELEIKWESNDIYGLFSDLDENRLWMIKIWRKRIRQMCREFGDRCTRHTYLKELLHYETP